MNEWVLVKLGGGIGGAIGTLAAIVSQKEVSRLQAFGIVSVGIGLSIFAPSFIASSIIIKYSLVNDFETLFGVTGLLGLLFGLIGFKIIAGVYKMASLFESNPIPFLRKDKGKNEVIDIEVKD